MFVNDRRDNWHKLLPFVMHAYRTSIHESTGYSPFRLMMGEECSLPQDVSTAELRTSREQDVSPHPFATWVQHSLEVAYDHVRESLHRTVAHRKRLYDTKAVNRKFPVGSWVLRYYPQLLSTSWVLPGLDLTKSFVRPPVIPLVSKRTRKNLSCLFMWTIWNYARDPRTFHGFRVFHLLNMYARVRWLSDRAIVWATRPLTPRWMCPVGRTWMIITVIKDLDRPIDITGHVLSPFHQRNLDYQDCRFHSIAHLMCYRYAIVNGQRTFATGIWKWSTDISLTFPRLNSRHLTMYNSGTLYWWTYTAICASRIQRQVSADWHRPTALHIEVSVTMGTCTGWSWHLTDWHPSASWNKQILVEWAESGRLCNRSLMIMWWHIILESIDNPPKDMDLWKPTER